MTQSIIVDKCYNNVNLIKKLILRNIDLNIKDNAGYTMLHKACIHNCIDSVNYLLDHGADIDITSDSYPYKTPLHNSIEFGNTRVVSVLLRYGANPTKKDKKVNLRMIMCVNLRIIINV